MRHLPEKSTVIQLLPAIVFLLFLTAVAAWNLLVPDREFSQMENRPLASAPRVTADAVRSGQWMSDFETYTSDQFPGRDGWMQLQTVLTRLSSRQDNGHVWFGDDGWLFSMEEPDEKGLAKNLQIVSRWIDQTQKSHPNVNVSILLAPTAHSVMEEKLPDHVLTDRPEEAALSDALTFLHSQVPDAVAPDLLQGLLQWRSSTASSGQSAIGAESGASQLYYRTDHHWTSEGAYIAYCQWAEETGLIPISPSEFQRNEVSKSFLGTTWSKAPDPLIEADTITCWTPLSQPQYSLAAWTDGNDPSVTEQRSSLYRKEALSQKDQYSFFLGGNDPQLLIRTPVRNGKKLLLIKDSYANCMVPFLALHYEEILITDLRYSHGTLYNDGRWPESDASASLPVTDIMFLYNIQSFSEDSNLAWLTRLEW